MAKQTLQSTDNGADSMDIINENFTEVYDDKLDTSAFDTQLATEVHAATGKTTPVDADEIGLIDSAASNVLKKLTWANLKATLKTYFDGVETTLTNKTLTSPTINTPVITSGCAFRVSRNAAANTGNNAFATVAFDTEQYDLGADVASGVFTAPADGYYTFSWNVGMTCDATARAIIAALFINGSEYSRGTQLVAVASGISSSGGTDTVYMTAGQTADIRAYGAVALALRVGTISYTFFSGRYVSS